MTGGLDVMLVNPGGRDTTYQHLGEELTAIEPPLWCRLIAGYLLDRGVTVDIIDSEATNMAPNAIAGAVAERKPRLVAMVVFGHQPSASTQQMAAANLACTAIKNTASEIPLIILGGHVSALPERTLQEESVDFACNGEGPVTVLQLLEAMASDRPDFAAVEGLVWHDGDVTRNNAPAPLLTDMDGDLHGDTWHLLPMDRYRAHNWQCFGDLGARQPYASIYTSLGCPFRCSFCCINAPFGTNRYRMRSPKAVIAEIDRLYSEYGVKTIKIIDEMFVLNDRHVQEISSGLAAKSYAAELNIWAYARVDTVKPEMLSLLREGGIRWLALGIESGSAHVRDGADKSFGQDDIREIVSLIQQADINVIGNYIFGLPDDDMATMRQTLDLALELNCEFANFYSAMAYPGSPLYSDAVQKGLPLPETWSGFSQHSYDCRPLPTEHVGAADVLRFRDAAFHEYFSAKRYLDMATQKFGIDTRHHIEGMAKARLARALLEDSAPAA